MKKTILIYKDYGVFDIEALKKELSSYFQNSNIIINTIDSSEIIDGSKLNKNTLALFIPGGLADKYFEKLGTKGNNNIRNYVKNGGIYLGICGGAYYACKKVEFETEIPELKIEAEYELNLINALAKGTLYKELGIQPFSNSSKSTAIVDIEDEKTKNISSAIYHGGPFFKSSKKEYNVLANYKLESGKKLHAIIQKKYGKGQVIVSGVHFEYTAKDLHQLLSLINKDTKLQEIVNKLTQKEKTRQQLFNSILQNIKWNLFNLIIIKTKKYIIS